MIGEVSTILINCVSNLKETNYVSLLNNVDSYKFFSPYNLKNQAGNKSLDILKNVQFGWETFTLSPIVYVAVDFKKLVSDLLHARIAPYQNYSLICPFLAHQRPRLEGVWPFSWRYTILSVARCELSVFSCEL